MSRKFGNKQKSSLLSDVKSKVLSVSQPRTERRLIATQTRRHDGLVAFTTQGHLSADGASVLGSAFRALTAVGADVAAVLALDVVLQVVDRLRRGNSGLVRSRAGLRGGGLT